MDFDSFIEIPTGSNVKYEVDEKTGNLRVDRFLHTAMIYPFNYGYVIDSKGQDGDPLDICVFSSRPVVPNVVMKCHAVGLLEMEDEAGIDTKIIAVPDKKIDPVYGIYEEINEIPKHLLSETKHFFDHYKELEPGKWIKTGEYKGKKEAEKEIEKSVGK